MQEARVHTRRSWAGVAVGLLVPALMLVSGPRAAAAEWALTTELATSTLVVGGQPTVWPSSTLGYGVSVRVTDQLEVTVSYARATAQQKQGSNVVSETVYSHPMLGVRWRFGHGSVGPHLYGIVGFPSLEVKQQAAPSSTSLSGTSYELGAGMVAALTSGTELVASVGYQGMSAKEDPVETNGSGIVARLGVRFPLGR